MNWIAMTVLLIVTLSTFAWSAGRRWRLMFVGQAPDKRGDQIGKRVGAVMRYVFGQVRMFRYPLPGLAHTIVFFGFLALLLNSIILWVRGYVPGFDFWIFGLDSPVGVFYAFVRDIFTVLVIIGVVVFFYYRGILRLQRLTLNAEGLAILGIIFFMMIADLVYEGAEIIHHTPAGESLFHGAMPFGSLFALLMAGLPEPALTAWWHVGFWTHAALVLIFMNLLPYGKHFHVITVIPNVFFQSLKERGRLEPIEDIEGRIEREETLGIRRVQDLSWKDILDLYTCTECGRCSEQCPANSTGKLLSPKHLSIHLRDHLYARQDELLGPARTGNAQADEAGLVPDTIKPEVLWACTTCAACEEECPVFISYIDKIVDMRRHLLMEQGEFPEQLQATFRGLETVGNPYSFATEQRAEWADGLDVPLRSNRPDAEYLLWVGCSPSFDDRARKIARATAQLLIAADVDFAILGPEEQCTGDPARRAGNEYLFQLMAQANVETMNGYNVKKIITICPHCYNTLKHEYPDFDGHYDVLHHSEFLGQLVRAARLKPQHRVAGQVVYHDACYLGRHNGIYDAPRDLLRAIPGLQLVEPEQQRDRAMCCGAGGAQMWKEEEEGDAKICHTRANQLLAALPGSEQDGTIATACPFCMTMISDGLVDQGHEKIARLDIAELLWLSVSGKEAKPAAVSKTAGEST
ncbi:MAG: 4Fe-4S dicluster domain-containing protein [Planctomycetes bacterium]|nr:4Fe-4S dicluster domain-containing protein [Planctomycetota bacterium]